MALLQTRVALRTDVRIAIGQRMWLHVSLSYNFVFHTNSSDFSRSQKSIENECRFFHAKEIIKYETRWEKGQGLTTIK